MFITLRTISRRDNSRAKVIKIILNILGHKSQIKITMRNGINDTAKMIITHGI